MKKPCEIVSNTLSLKKHVRIKLLGDSITHGVGGMGFQQNGYSFIDGFARNPDGSCWANTFRKYMEEKFDCSVVNNACTGTDIEFIIDHFDILVEEEDDLIICTIGTNNRHVFFDTGNKPSREELGKRFYNNVVKLNHMLTAAGKAFIFIANIPASDENEQDGEDYWRILHMEDINAIYKAAARESGFALISLYDLFRKYCETNNILVDSLLCDGLHPNDRGYDVMFDLMIQEFRLY